MGADEDTVRVDAEALRALAAGVAVDRSLEVVAGAPGCGWRIDTHTGRIQVDPHDLEHLPADQLYGLTCHEAAHAAMTRYPWLVPASVLAEPGVRTLLNALEDCRIESWLMKRFPGATPWIEACNARLYPADPFDPSGKVQTDGGPPLFWQFSIATLHEWWFGSRPKTVDPRVGSALERTADARRAVIARLPPAHAQTPDAQQSHRYANSRVARVFNHIDGLGRPDPFEIAVRLAAAEAWSRTWSDILPAFRELVAIDPPEAVNRAENVLLGRMGDVSGWTREVAYHQPTRQPGDLDAARTQREPSDAPTSSVHLPEVDEAVRAEALEPIPDGAWDDARRDVLPLVDALCDEFLRVLRPRTLPRWLSGYSTGLRVDLRRGMQAQARVEMGARGPLLTDTRTHDPFRDLWERKTLPVRPDPRFLLLVDLSGSMRGAPIHWGFRGTVLLAEVLERLALPVAIYGFQDTLIPFKRFETPLELATTGLSAMPHEVHGTRPGGHNRPEHNWDGPVLLEATEVLLEAPCRTPVLMVVSDGEPSGPADAAACLHRAVASVSGSVQLVGLGLGPGTHHVRTYYPNAVADVPLSSFPEAIGRCIRAALLDGPAMTHTRPLSEPA